MKASKCTRISLLAPDYWIPLYVDIISALAVIHLPNESNNHRSKSVLTIFFPPITSTPFAFQQKADTFDQR